MAAVTAVRVTGPEISLRRRCLLQPGAVCGPRWGALQTAAVPLGGGLWAVARPLVRRPRPLAGFLAPPARHSLRQRSGPPPGAAGPPLTPLPWPSVATREIHGTALHFLSSRRTADSRSARSGCITRDRCPAAAAAAALLPGAAPATTAAAVAAAAPAAPLLPLLLHRCYRS
jgi:hypothetical protein